MKKALILIFSLFTFHFSLSWAVPADPYHWFMRQKADGSQVKVKIMGDEFCHYLVDEEGNKLDFQTLEPLGTTVEQLWNNSQSRRLSARRKIRMEGTGLVPTTGSPKALIVLVQFKDKKFSMSDPVTYYKNYLSQKGFSQNGATGSCLDWYKEASNGLYTPQFDVYGPVTVSGSCKTDYAGGEGSYEGLQNTWKLVNEVVKALDPTVDFSQYATGGQKYCDNIYIVYAGYGSADSYESACIWPHNWHVSEASGNASNVLTVDGVKVDRYTVSAEINGHSGYPAGIGTFIHEFGHVLGIPDLYNTQTSDSTVPGYWDVMCNGNYNNNQNTPPLFSAYERMCMGWISPKVITRKEADYVTLKPLETYPEEALRINISGKENEYFILENRQQTGTWDKYLPGHGMLVWHLDEDQQVWNANGANTNSSHRRVDIVQASSQYSSAYSFPGTLDVTSYGFTGWGKEDVFGICDVKEQSGNISVLFDGCDRKIDTPTLTLGTVTSSSATVSWSTPTLANKYKVVLKRGTLVLYSETLTSNSVTFSRLLAETEHTVSITAMNQQLASETATLNFTTSSASLSTKKVVALKATDVTETEFTANWEALDGADNGYEVQVYEGTASGSAQTGTGFDEGFSETEPNLPDGWTTDVTTTSSSTYGGESGPPSFKFGKDDSYLQMTKASSKLTKLTFWRRTTSSKNSLTVEQLVDGNWKQVGEAISDVAGHEDTYTATLDNADAVRIIYHGSVGNFFIDDTYITHTNFIYTASDKFSTADTSLKVDNLSADKSYAYEVRGVNKKGEYSQWSDRIVVDKTVVSGIETMGNGQYEVGNYDMFNVAGQKVNGKTKGIVIVKGKKYIIK